ncbi:metallophosphoesterase [bacterium]|nr:metallophosphoesterase [bacterium]
MKKSHRIVALALIGLAAATAVALTFGTACAVVARHIDAPSDLLGGTAAAGQLGDYLLANDEAAFIITAPAHAHGHAQTGGNIIDAAAAPGWTDELGGQFTLLGEFPRQALYASLAIESDGSTGPAVILVTGVDSDNPSVVVTTTYTLEDGNRYVTIETELENTGPTVTGYSAGDVLDWENGTHFVPGYGTDVTGLSTVTEWTASKGTAVCYAYTTTSGAFSVTHGSDWSHPIVTTADLLSGGTLLCTRAFATGEPDLASVSDAVHEIRGLSTGILEGTAVDEVTGVGIQDACIDCRVNTISPYTEAVSDSIGAFTATLPQSNYGLMAQAPGYYPGETSIFVIAGMTNELEFELMPHATSEGRCDTLTTVMRPILSVPAIVTPGQSFTIEAIASPTTSDCSAELRLGGLAYELGIWNTNYSHAHERWFMSASVPSGVPEAVFDLVVEASGVPADTVAHAVSVRASIDSDFYFIHVTDTHLPTHMYHWQQGAEADTSEMVDFRAVIDDANIINPAFVLHTGDLVNEGELEDYLGWRVFSKGHRIMRELDVPVFLVGGNHDLGGWDDTPPPDGTARRDWWSFFGWRYLADPPAGDGIYTQNYTFDYADAHFVGLEAYNNYDGWRYGTYGSDSFTDLQLAWLLNDLAATPPDMAEILFYHIDFQWQLDLGDLGVDCSVWGHIHNNWGSIEDYPYDLGTDSCCDDTRAFRLIRVSGNTVIPTETLYAGNDGEDLNVSYYPANDGSAAVISAVVVNDHGQTFEHAVVRFRVPADSAPYETDNGTITQTLVDGDVATVTVALPILEHSTTYVSIAPTTGLPDTGPTRLALAPCRPNPARSGATMSFVLPSRAEVRLKVYDVTGRRVAVLVDEVLDGGGHDVEWDLRDATGGAVASGIYFVRLDAGGSSAHEKLVVLR